MRWALAGHEGSEARRGAAAPHSHLCQLLPQPLCLRRALAVALPLPRAAIGLRPALRGGRRLLLLPLQRTGQRRQLLQLRLALRQQSPVLRGERLGLQHHLRNRVQWGRGTQLDSPGFSSTEGAALDSKAQRGPHQQGERSAPTRAVPSRSWCFRSATCACRCPHSASSARSAASWRCEARSASAARGGGGSEQQAAGGVASMCPPHAPDAQSGAPSLQAHRWLAPPPAPLPQLPLPAARVPLPAVLQARLPPAPGAAAPARWRR